MRLKLHPALHSPFCIGLWLVTFWTASEHEQSRAAILLLRSHLAAYDCDHDHH